MIASLALFALLAPQTTWFVDAAGTSPGTGTQTDPYTRVDYAVAQPTTVSGDTVQVAQGFYQHEVIDFAGKDLVLLSTGAVLQSDHSNAAPSLITLQSGESSAAVIDGFNLNPGGARDMSTGLAHGGGIFIQGANPTIRNCTFRYNNNGNGITIDRGGGLYVDNAGFTGMVSVQNCTFFDFRVWRDGGGAFFQSATADLQDCEFRSNYSNQGGAGLSSQNSQLTVRDTQFLNNDCYAYFAAGDFRNSDVVLTDCTVTRTNGSNNVGGFAFSNGTATVRDCAFVNLRGGHSGVGLFFSHSVSKVERCEFRNNVYQGDFDSRGGAISQVGGSLWVNDSLFEGNISEHGGAIRSQADTVILNSIFTGNKADHWAAPVGGALWLNGPFQVIGCRFEANDGALRNSPFGGAQGGAIHASASGLIRDCIFLGNLLEDTPGSSSQGYLRGGAVSAEVLIRIDRCLFQDNRVAGSNGNDDGGALFGPVIARNCTFRNNVSLNGGFNTMSGGTLTDCIVWPSAAPALGPNVAVSYSIVQGGAPGTGNLDVDPLYWGPLDSHLMPNSPAIDTGDPASPLDPDGSRIDLGFFPYDPLHCTPGCFGFIGTPQCAGQPNSTGVPGQMAALGNFFASENLLVLHATDLPTGEFGYFLGSQSPGFVPGFGGSQGNLCLGGQLLRFNRSILTVRPDGSATQRQTPAAFPQGVAVQAGQSWYFQFWHRDQVAGQATSNTTASTRVDFL